MVLYCHHLNHSFDNFTSRLLHQQEKGDLLNDLEQVVEILLAQQHAASTNRTILNDTRHTFLNPFLQFFLALDINNFPILTQQLWLPVCC